jgi:serine/threonine-protein kinase
MGVVFEGVADGQEPVAIKVVTTELSQDEVFVRRFQREVAAAQKISHPHVVPVLGAGEEGGLPYLVQALIAGGSLHDRLVADGALDLATTVRLLRGPAEGIDALHASGLVHRDIKPGNILLDGETAYVTDFGLAKDSQASNLTRPGQALGSLDYMAPEQIRGEEVSAATDIYALGCMIHECLTGTPPFGGRPRCACSSPTCRRSRRTSPNRSGATSPPPWRRRSTRRWRRRRRTVPPPPPATSPRSPAPPGSSPTWS